MHVPSLFTGHHHFVLHRTQTGTKVEHYEEFSGILAMVLLWIGSSMYKNLLDNFDMMKQALKTKIETGTRTVN